MKKIIGLMILLVLVTSVITFGDEIIEMFNIDTLSGIAVENSLELDASLLSLESKELNLEEVNKDAFNADQMGGDRVTYIKNQIIVQSDTLIAEMNVKLAEMSILKEEENIKNDIYKKGMSYLLLLDELVLNERILEIKELYKEFTEQKVENNIATSTELVNKVIDVQSQEMKVLELQSSLESSKIEINHLLGNELDAELNIDDEIKIEEFYESVIGYVYNQRVETYPDVYKKSETYKSKEIIFNLYAEKYVEADKEYKIALYDKQIAEIEIEESKKSFEVSLIKSYNEFLNSHDSYLLSIKQNELSHKLYDDAKLKYDLGLISTEELLKVEESKINSDFSLKKAVYNFNVSKINVDSLY